MNDLDLRLFELTDSVRSKEIIEFWTYYKLMNSSKVWRCTDYDINKWNHLRKIVDLDYYWDVEDILGKYPTHTDILRVVENKIKNELNYYAIQDADWELSYWFDDCMCCDDSSYEKNFKLDLSKQPENYTEEQKQELIIFLESL